MLLHLGKAYYALEAKTMATDELLPPSSWDCDYCGDPPPFFHLPPPPQPPGILGPLEGSSRGPEDCTGQWTCPALEAGGTFGQYEDGSPPRALPDMSVSVIIVSTAILGFIFVVAAIIFASRLWRSYKASSKKASCDLDGGDLYEDMPAAPPLLAPPHRPMHCPPPLRYKQEMLPPPRGCLPPTPALHLYSPEPRSDTPSDHLYHHISSGSETCSCSTSEAPCNTILPTSLQLIHSEEDEGSSACSRSSHSYNSSSTATPTSSPTPVISRVGASPTALYLCPPNIPGPPTSMLPGYTNSALHYNGGGKYKQHPGGPHQTSLQSVVYAVNPVQSNQHKHACTASNMLPLAQIYSPGSHLYESATLIRPNANMPPTCSMVHWGNVPAPFVQAVNSHQTIKPPHQYDPRHPPPLVSLHTTMVHPLQYAGHNGMGAHSCGAQQHTQMNTIDLKQYHPSVIVHPHHPHVHHYHQHPTHLPLPLHSSTLIHNNKLAKSMYDVARSPEDLTPTNSIPIDSIYKVSPNCDVDLIATTCLSTVSSIPAQQDYSTTLDAINLNSHPIHRLYKPDDYHHVVGVSDTSSSSHPSTITEVATVTESSSLDSSSNTTSSTTPLTNSLNIERKDLPPLPSRADRYRIYAHTNDSSLGSRFSSYRRPSNIDNNINNNNNNGANAAAIADDNRNVECSVPRNVKSCHDLQNSSSVDNPRLQLSRDHLEASNAVNNNEASNSALMHCTSKRSRSNRGQLNQGSSCRRENFDRQSLGLRDSTKGGVLERQNNEAEDEEEDIYDQCSDT